MREEAGCSYRCQKIPFSSGHPRGPETGRRPRSHRARVNRREGPCAIPVGSNRRRHADFRFPHRPLPDAPVLNGGAPSARCPLSEPSGAGALALSSQASRRPHYFGPLSFYFAGWNAASNQRPLERAGNERGRTSSSRRRPYYAPFHRPQLIRYREPAVPELPASKETPAEPVALIPCPEPTTRTDRAHGEPSSRA